MYYKYSVLFIQPFHLMLLLLLLQTQSVVALECPPGEYWYSSSSVNECRDCPQGYQNNATDNTRYCNACPRGYWGATSRALSCEECIAGKYSIQLGLTNSDDCTDCPTHFLSNAGAGDCYYHCAPGHYLTSTDTGPGSLIQSYDKGFYTMDGEQIELTMLVRRNQAYCNQVPTGEYMDESGAIVKDYDNHYNMYFSNSLAVNTYGAKPCPGGSYSDELGARVCKLCPIGYSQLEPKQNACIECSSGNYADATGQTECNVCQAGRYNDVVGLSIDYCTPCNIGYYQPQEGQNSCLVCPIGEYNDEIGMTYCNVCPTEQTSLDAIRSNGQCLNCESGRYSNGTACVICPAGYYNGPEHIANTFCYACADGKYNPNEGSLDSSACQTCPLGFWGKDAFKSDCNSCAPGTYPECAKKGSECALYYDANGVFVGTSSPDTCVDCPIGYAQDTANIGCIRCEVGKYAKGVGNVYCLSCPGGYYDFMTGNSEWVQPYYHRERTEQVGLVLEDIDDTFTLLNDILPLYTTAEFCQHCPAGFFRLERTDNTIPYDYALDSYCIACPEGFYSRMKSGGCTTCTVLE